MRFFTPENGTSQQLQQQNATQSNSVVESQVKKPILFEKSATYFDNELVPRRAHALLPKSKIVST